MKLIIALTALVGATLAAPFGGENLNGTTIGYYHDILLPRKTEVVNRTGGMFCANMEYPKFQCCSGWKGRSHYYCQPGVFWLDTGGNPHFLCPDPAQNAYGFCCKEERKLIAGFLYRWDCESDVCFQDPYTGFHSGGCNQKH